MRRTIKHGFSRLERQPFTHHCWYGECPPAPGPHFLSELCGYCYDEVNEDYAEQYKRIIYADEAEP